MISPDWDRLLTSERERIPLIKAGRVSFVEGRITAKVCWDYYEASFEKLSDMTHYAIDEFVIDKWEAAEPFLQAFVASGKVAYVPSSKTTILHF